MKEVSDRTVILKTAVIRIQKIIEAYTVQVGCTTEEIESFNE